MDFSLGGTSESSVLGRMEIWSKAIFMLEDYPFTGIGMGLFGPVADTLYPFTTFTANTVEHAHNLFLQIGLDLGIPGLISWLSILGINIVTAWIITLRGKRKWHMGLGAGLLAGQLAILFHGMTDSVLWGMVRPSPMIWLIWGLVFSAYRLTLLPIYEKNI